MKTRNPNINERGSVFFFILIGIALFAALSYAITQSVRIGTDASGGVSGTTERNTATVTDLMQFLEALKMRIFEMGSNGVPDTQFDFKNDVYKMPSGSEVTANNNATCINTENCSVFVPYAPSGINPMIFLEAADKEAQTGNSLPKNGHGRVGEIDIKAVGSTAPDLVFIIQGIKPAICNLYNAKLGITTDYKDTTTLGSIGENDGTSMPDDFSNYTTAHTFGYGASIFEGKKSFCAPAASGGQAHRLAIWQVLKAR